MTLLNIALGALAGIALLIPTLRHGGDGAGVEVERRAAPAGVDEIVVQVTGAVASPGVVTAEPGDRVADVLERAGGALPGANLDAVNLALRIRDEDIVRVPFEGDAVLPLVNLNTADRAEIERLPGVGPARARAIIEARPLASVEELIERDLLPTVVWEEIRMMVTTR